MQIHRNVALTMLMGILFVCGVIRADDSMQDAQDKILVLINQKNTTQIKLFGSWIYYKMKASFIQKAADDADEAVRIANINLDSANFGFEHYQGSSEARIIQIRKGITDAEAELRRAKSWANAIHTDLDSINAASQAIYSTATTAVRGTVDAVNKAIEHAAKVAALQHGIYGAKNANKATRNQLFKYLVDACIAKGLKDNDNKTIEEWKISGQLDTTLSFGCIYNTDKPLYPTIECKKVT